MFPWRGVDKCDPRSPRHAHGPLTRPRRTLRHRSSRHSVRSDPAHDARPCAIHRGPEAPRKRAEARHEQHLLELETLRRIDGDLPQRHRVCLSHSRTSMHTRPASDAPNRNRGLSETAGASAAQLPRVRCHPQQLLAEIEHRTDDADHQPGGAPSHSGDGRALLSQFRCAVDADRRKHDR
jgi:hypothetical protein